MEEPGILSRLKGEWAGVCRTWLEDKVLSDESSIRGEFQGVLEGQWIRHCYLGSLRGQKRQGEELIVFNSVSCEFEITWIDDFHMANGILFSSGVSSVAGFSVVGSYSVGIGETPWGWRTTYHLGRDNCLKIISYNIEPDGSEVKAIEIEYERIESLV